MRAGAPAAICRTPFAPSSVSATVPSEEVAGAEVPVPKVPIPKVPSATAPGATAPGASTPSAAVPGTTTAVASGACAGPMPLAADHLGIPAWLAASSAMPGSTPWDWCS